MIVDTHAHLQMEEFAADLPQVLARARDAGVGRLVTVGVELESSAAAVALADRHPEVWAVVGVHPHDAATWDGDTARRLEGLLDHPKVVGVGETGLDFFRQRAPAGDQERAFRHQIRIARERDLPLVVHSRQAHQRVLEILREESPLPGGVLHCFSGNLEEARDALALGLFLSFGAPLTYPNAGETRRIAGAVATDRILLETDCPYLPPQGRRGSRNEPSLMGETVAALAGITGLSTDDVARITTDGARRLFGLGLDVRGAVAYRIRDSLYLNITNRCPNRCGFCHRGQTWGVKGHHLKLDVEPSAAEILEEVSRQRDYGEAVFCGYGEPLLRPTVVKTVAAAVRQGGHRVRVNTNGLASLVHGRSLPRELAPDVDHYSVSLNAPDADTYRRVCRPTVEGDAFGAVLAFIREALEAGAGVTATAVALPDVDLEACRRLAASLGAGFRVRPLDEVG
jgi:TatD DNase family protein